MLASIDVRYKEHAKCKSLRENAGEGNGAFEGLQGLHSLLPQMFLYHVIQLADTRARHFIVQLCSLARKLRVPSGQITGQMEDGQTSTMLICGLQRTAHHSIIRKRSSCRVGVLERHAALVVTP